MAKKNTIDKQTKEYMESVYQFLRDKNNGNVPAEYGCSLLMLQTYYKQFLQLNADIDNLDSIIVDSRYGKVPSPLLNARDKTVSKLDTILKQIGCTFVAAKRLKLEKSDNTPLDEYLG